MISDYRISSSSDFSAASFKAWKIFGEALKFPGPWASPSEAFLLLLEVLPSHRLQSHLHFKGLPFSLLLLQDTKCNLLNGFNFYRIVDQDQKCLADSIGFWPCDKNLPCGKSPQKAEHLLTMEERTKQRENKYKLIFQKLMHHTPLTV